MFAMDVSSSRPRGYAASCAARKTRRRPQSLRPPASRGLVGVRGFEPPTPCSQSRCATELRHTPVCPGEYTARPEARSRRGQEPLAGAATRLGAVADAVLLLSGALGEAAPERRVEEQRVVAEATVAARRFEQDALDHAFDRDLTAAARADDGDEAAKARG